MRNDHLLSACLLIIFTHGAAAGADSAANRPEEGHTGCCRHDAAAITQFHKNADRHYAQFKPREAAAELEKILQQDPRNFEALVKLSRAHIDIGDMIPESSQNLQEKRMEEYSAAEQYARRAVKADPNSTWGHFYVAASLGNIAMLSPVEKQIDLAEEIRRAVERAIALDPQNGFAYHAYGVWHRKMAEIGKMSRMFASVLYGRSVPGGSLEKSIDYLRKAVELNPRVIVSRLELARSYAAVQDWPSARNYLKSIQDLPVQFSDDARHKRDAEQLLAEISDRQTSKKSTD